MLQRLRAWLIALLTTVLVIAASGCENTPISDYCLIASQIRPTSADVDVISDALVEQILTHNEQHAKLCK